MSTSLSGDELLTETSILSYKLGLSREEAKKYYAIHNTRIETSFYPQALIGYIDQDELYPIILKVDNFQANGTLLIGYCKNKIFLMDLVIKTDSKNTFSAIYRFIINRYGDDYSFNREKGIYNWKKKDSSIILKVKREDKIEKLALRILQLKFDKKCGVWGSFEGL